MLKVFSVSILIVTVIQINVISSLDYNFRREGELRESFGRLNVLVKNLRQILKTLMEYKRDKYLKMHKLPLNEVNDRIPDHMKIIPQLRRVRFKCSECLFNATAFLGLWKHMKNAHKIDISKKWLNLIETKNKKKTTDFLEDLIFTIPENHMDGFGGGT
uniref:Uncharacterized protein n=1 Tax=Cacopsylla melanoneura TaxID=428564 RepID=A0A8D8QSP4_9HEMI